MQKGQESKPESDTMYSQLENLWPMVLLLVLVVFGFLVAAFAATL